MNNEITKIKQSIRDKEKSEDANMISLFYALSTYLVFSTVTLAGRVYTA
jgi:predicted transcriptional regulator